ncbi:MAG: hypothetical protein WKF73_14855 [Nocardioidaceae bacterium]
MRARGTVRDVAGDRLIAARVEDESSQIGVQDGADRQPGHHDVDGSESRGGSR